MIFYNGFNLLIDVIIATVVGIIAYKDAWWQGYAAGTEDTLRYQGYKEQHDLDQYREQE